MGAVSVLRTAFPHVRQSDKVSIVSVASISGGRAYPGGGAYGPSKAALISLTRQLAVEWAG